MDNDMLRKVQFVQLEIAEEIVRVCNKNHIKVFLDSGSLIGAVRHHGFIPWDDDLDMGMLREDYDRFSAIASHELSPDYYWQTWETDSDYAMPFGKVRKKGTQFIESRSPKLKENGIYVDVIPYDYAPDGNEKRKAMYKQLADLRWRLTVKCGYAPWIYNGKAIFKTRLHGLYYQVITKFQSKEQLVQDYERIVRSIADSEYVYQQTGTKYYPKKWFEEIVLLEFEDVEMPVISHYHDWLTTAYGDYMTPPPENARENRHDIVRIEL